MATETQIQQAKDKLEETRITLEKDIERLESPTDLGDGKDGYDADTEADEAEEFSANAGAARTLRERHEAIVTALSKIDRKVYGKCEKSDEDIEWEILEINPEAKFCKKHIQGED